MAQLGTMAKASAYKVYSAESGDPAPSNEGQKSSDKQLHDSCQPSEPFRKPTSRAIFSNGDTFTAPAEITRVQSAVGLLLLYMALATTSAPLFDRTIDGEEVRDNVGVITIKNASYAKAYFLPSGFFAQFADAMNNNQSALDWFPQTTETAFLGIPYMDRPAKGACAILDQEDPNAPECIIMSGHQGRVSAYGLCRNGSAFVSILYVSVLTTPASVRSMVSSGNWIENSRESILAGVLETPRCVGGTTVEVYPNAFDLRGISGAFALAESGRTGQWYDMMNLPTVVRERMHYLVEKAGSGEGIVLPNVMKASYDNVISSNLLGVTLASKLEIVAPTPTSQYVYIVLHRLAATTVKLPRLQFTLAVAAQALALLLYMLVITLSNGALNTYHLVTQILRLPTFSLIAAQLMYVSYYQIFGLMYVHTSESMNALFTKKAIYLAGVMFILLQQLDVRAAVTLWPKMANNDAYYLWRVAWMLTSLGVFVWSMTLDDPAHYIVAALPNCQLGASECNQAAFFLPQHYVAIVTMLLHPLAYGLIQVAQRRQYGNEYYPVDNRTAKNMTAFEANGCGAPLCRHYYYNTIVSRKEEDGSVMHMTCGKAVRDEGFVMLGGCNMLIRAKDLVLVLFFRYLPRYMANTLNMSVVVAELEDDQLTPLRRVSYSTLHKVSRRWNGRISYPDIG